MSAEQIALFAEIERLRESEEEWRMTAEAQVAAFAEVADYLRAERDAANAKVAEVVAAVEQYVDSLEQVMAGPSAEFYTLGDVPADIADTLAPFKGDA